MAINKTAYTYNINPNASGSGENNAVHQTSPAWVLTFMRWQVRDTLRTEPTSTLNYTSIPVKPLVVENDCIQLGIADSKTVLTPSMNAVLLVTDVNYETEIAPGDFVFVNMLNWEQDARRVADKARNLKPINGPNDGFKGFFKVQSVIKTLTSDLTSGTKTYAINITGFAFTEFNNSIYFNPYLLSATNQNLNIYLSLIGLDWAAMHNDKGLTRIQDIMRWLINSFIGAGFPDGGIKTNEISPLTPNTHFYMPRGVGQLLGLTTLKSAKDAYNFIFGIQSYSPQALSLAQGMNPANISPTVTQNSRFIILQDAVEGNTVTKPEYWNQQKAWSILNQFTNSPLNELYTCFRTAPNGSVMPTVVFRQIPFTNDNFNSGDYKVTKFMSLPRWNVSPALALSFKLGRDEALRMNFVQYYGRSVNSPGGLDIAEETARQNYVYDSDDVQRNGLRPYVVTSEFDWIPDVNVTQSNASPKASFRSPGWAKIVGDALIGGQLKMTGTIEFVGLPEPIAVGDNLQFDGVVYHIEQINHNATMQPQTGKKTFRTTVMLTNGLSIESGANVMYSEMKYGGGYDSRENDYNHSQILPGVSESQDTVYRNAPNDPDNPTSGGQSFIQPNTNASVNKTTRDSGPSSNTTTNTPTDNSGIA